MVEFNGSGKTTILNRIKESYERKEIFIGQKVGFFGEPTDSTVANALLKDMYSMFPLANDQFETLQKYLLAVEANDLCSALSSSSYDIVYFDTSILFGILFLQTVNDLKIINKETYSNCLTFYYQMISNINFENAEVTILKVIPPIDRCKEKMKEIYRITFKRYIETINKYYSDSRIFEYNLGKNLRGCDIWMYREFFSTPPLSLPKMNVLEWS
ncbi:hypothetical protein ACTFIZ_005578 [Dictyostelium cf. discoideum]